MPTPLDTETLFKNLEGKVSEITLRTYKEKIKMLTTQKDKKLPLLDCLTKNVDATYKRLQSKYKSVATRKSIVSVILSLYTHTPSFASKHKKSHDDWVMRFKNLKIMQREISGDNRMTEEKKKMIPTAAEMKKAIKNLDHANLKTSLQYILFLMVTLMPPKRRDYGALKIVKTEPKESKGNYVVVPAKGAVTLVMNEYKTSDKYGTYREEMPVDLAAEVRESLIKYPRDYLFVGRDKDKMSDAAYGQFVKASFVRQIGKETTMNDLRHAYITANIDPSTMTQNEMHEVAQKMNHSVAMQGAYILVDKSKKKETK